MSDSISDIICTNRDGGTQKECDLNEKSLLSGRKLPEIGNGQRNVKVVLNTRMGS